MSKDAKFRKRGYTLGTFNPRNLPNLVLHLDAQDGDTLKQDSAGTTPAASDGDVVGRWEDKSGNGHHVTQATTANKPLLKLGAMNGRSVLRFDGTDFLDGGDILDMLDDDFTFIAVGKANATDGTYASKSILNNSSGRYALLYSSTNISSLYHGSGATSYSTNVASTPGSYEFFSQVVVRASAHTLYKNGAQIGQRTDLTGDGSSANLSNTFKVGAYSDTDNSPALQLVGDIFMILRYNRALNTNELTKLHKWISQKSGIPLA